MQYHRFLAVPADRSGQNRISIAFAEKMDFYIDKI